MTKAKNLRDQSLQELQASLDDARKNLFMLRNEFQGGNAREKPHRTTMMRKEIARLLTILHEKQTASQTTQIEDL